jgi:hypothetical protein
MKNYCFNLLILFIVGTTFSTKPFAQSSNDDFQILLSKSGVPEEFKLNPATIFKRIDASLKFEKGTSSSKQKALKAALVKEEYDFILSGKPIFGDVFTERLKPIFEKLTESDADLKHLRFMVVREGTKVFVIGNDIIVVPIELISQLSSESQLAYLMSEVMYKLKTHQLEKQYLSMGAVNMNSAYTADEAAQSLVNTLWKYQVSTNDLYKQNVNGALNLVVAADYSTSDLEYVYSTIKYAYLPYKQSKMSLSSYFGSPFDLTTEILTQNATLKDTFSYPVFENLSTTTTVEITVDEKADKNAPAKYDDMEAELNLLIGSSSSKGSFHAMKDSEFKELVEIAQVETIGYDLNQGAYQKVVYNASNFLEKYPNSKLLRVYKAQALLMLAQIRLSRFKDENNLNTNFVGIANSMMHLTSEQKAVIALKYIYQNWKKYPTDRQTNLQLESILSFFKNELEINMKSQYFPEKYVRINNKVESKQEGEKELSKFDRIRMKNQGETFSDSLTELTSVFHKYEFKTLYDDAEFMAKYDATPLFDSLVPTSYDKNAGKLALNEKAFLMVHGGLRYKLSDMGRFVKVKPGFTSKLYAKLNVKMKSLLKKHAKDVTINMNSESGAMSADLLNQRYVENLLLFDEKNMSNESVKVNGKNYDVNYLHFKQIYAPSSANNLSQEIFGDAKSLLIQDFSSDGRNLGPIVIPAVLFYPAFPFYVFSLSIKKYRGSFGIYNLETDSFDLLENKNFKTRSFGKLRIYKKSLKRMLKK